MSGDEQPRDDATPLPAGIATQETRGARFAAIGLTVLAALFSGVVIGVLISVSLADPDSGIPQSGLLTELKDISAKQPALGKLKEAIRVEDKRLRDAHATRRHTTHGGIALLVVGLACMVAAGRWYIRLDARLPKARKASTSSQAGCAMMPTE
jgi:hypothetical protein